MNILDEATEVIFWGADRGPATIRDNTGILGGGRTGTVQPDAGGGNDLTITEQFARSLSVRDALSRDNMLCYEMNGRPLPPEHGFPVRLIAPGCVRSYEFEVVVSIREEQRGNETVWTLRPSAGTDSNRRRPKSSGRAIATPSWAPLGEPPSHRLKFRSMAARGTLQRCRIIRARPEDGRVTTPGKFWTFDWGSAATGEHTIRSRAYDVDGNVQPAANDPFLASLVTFWEGNGQVARRVLIP